MMRKLIINADDLGISFKVNHQIEECINKHLITSTTLMANAPAFEDGVCIAKKYPQISVGVHLNIIEFAPLTNTDLFKRHGVVDQNGHFIDGAFFFVDIDEELKQAVFEEWDAQICKVIEAGICPTHCDSHQHTHTIFALQEPLCRVLDKYNISWVRRKMVPSIRTIIINRMHPTVHLDKSGSMKQPRKTFFYRVWHFFIFQSQCRRWNKQMAEHYSMTNIFFPFQLFYANRNILHCKKRQSTIELMCHPGHEGYQIEYNNLLAGPNWKEAEYQLISYREI